MALLEVNDKNFDSEVSKGVVLVDFWAPWCGPCKMIAPILEDLQNQLGDKTKIVKLNVDDNPQLAEKYGVMSIPTLLFFKDGTPVDKVVGFQPKDTLVKKLEKLY